MVEIMEYAGDLLTQVHVADSFDHTASSGLRYILNPPGTPARIHQHLDIGQGEVDWDAFFGTLERLGFGRREETIMTACVFAWEDRAARVEPLHARADRRPHQGLGPAVSPAVAAAAPEVLTVGRVGVDLYPSVDGHPEHSARRSRTSRPSTRFLGGTATNVAVGAARLGHRSAVLTKVGPDAFGDYVREALAGFGVDPRLRRHRPTGC